MNGQTVILNSEVARYKAKRLVDLAPAYAVVNIKEARRTTDQNALLWALLSQISRAKPEGRTLPPETWKCLFMAACGFECTFQPGLDGEGFVPLGYKSSRLRKAEFSELIECIHEYAARHEIALDDDAPHSTGTGVAQ